MDEKPEQPTNSAPSGINRRRFIAAVGATAATSAAFLRELAEGQNTGPLYQDSFGNISPVSSDLLALGLIPPPLPLPNQNQQGNQDAEHRHAGSSHPDREKVFLNRGDDVSKYTPPNYIMIMVDQLRAPRWLPPPTGTSPGGQAALDDVLTNIAALRNMSFVFPNYFPAATACTPSRSTLLTGLYTQQTCLFVTQDTTTCEPNLQTGTPVSGVIPTFPNIATVLGQATGANGVPLGYSSYWIGKWHLSDPLQGGSMPGDNGPSDYGFLSASGVNPLSLPFDNSLPSPNGTGNLGTEGYNPSGNYPAMGAQPFGLCMSCGGMGTGACTCPPPHSTHPLYNDAAICDFFINRWIPYVPTGSPYFVAVSFVNPHDITQFPFSYNLIGQPGFTSTAPTNYPTAVYPQPPITGSVGTGSPPSSLYYDTSLPPLLPPVIGQLYPTTGSSLPGWNYADDPSIPANGKPTIQSIYQSTIANRYGTVVTGASTTVAGWSTFLNYYIWMQQCVDVQIGRILTALSNNVVPGGDKAVIIFLSDHGEYGGSHALHAKGGALYDESINVPLYISFPSMRSTPQTATVRFTCSSVDILPFLYGLAQGDDATWRTTSTDMIYYLKNRESILDAIFNYAVGSHPGDENTTAKQRRVSGIANLTNPTTGNPYTSQAGQTAQPYVLHTSDEFGNTVVGYTNVPGHAVGFRTVDLSPQATSTNPDGTLVNGGGMLGIYSLWNGPGQTNPTFPSSATPQREFYDLTGTSRVGNIPNWGQTGNDYSAAAGSLSQVFVTAFGSIKSVELYLSPVPSQIASVYNAALAAYESAQGIGSCRVAALSPLLDG